MRAFAISVAHKFLSRIAAEAGDAILRSTVPIYRDVDSEIGIDFDRTGLLFRIGLEHFVLSASHDIEQYLKDNTRLYADVSQRTSGPIPMVQSMFYGTEVDNSFPDRDIIAIHLNHDAVDQFYPQRHFLTLAECDLQIDPKPAFYMVAGYTWDKYKMAPVADGPFTYFVGTIESNPTTENYDPHVHLALSLNERGRMLTDDGFDEATIPEFYGMSGCGIWRVAPLTMSDPDAWDASMVRLVAIQNRTRYGSHTIGTWLKHVIDRIVLSFPSLKQAVEITHELGY